MSSLTAGVLIVCLLSGCAAGLLALAFKALSVGALVAEVSDLFGKESSDYTLYFDGYNTGQHPDADRTLDLTGLPVGHHVLTLASSDQTLGFHKHVQIVANGNLNLGSITPISGGTISGRVQRVVSGTNVPLAGVRVAAILGGGNIINASASRQIVLPPNNDTDVVIMGFTDASGNYRLGPAQYGNWIVTAAYPGYLADAVVAQVASGDNATGVNLVLPVDTSALPPGTVQGTIVRDSGGALSGALVALNLGVPFAPLVSSDRLADLQSDFGALRDQPWFAWTSLATQTTTAGSYVLVAPPGAHQLYGFRYQFIAQTADISLGSSETVSGDFTLESR